MFKNLLNSAQNASGKCWYRHIFKISVPTGTEVGTFHNTSSK